MPEYLAPGVYVEEVDTGSKPIEGVSTSTAGMVGVTERGPLHVPIPITSYGEYTRWFGERLNVLDFSNGDGPHCYLPQAVEGFFINGGKRLFVARVLDEAGAANATFTLHDRGTAAGTHTVLLRPAPANSGNAANPPLLVVVPDPNLAQNDRIRVGDGSAAEYRRVALAPIDDRVVVTLALPLARAHADPGGPITVGQFTPAAALRSFVLAVAPPATRLPAGEETLEIAGTAADLDALDAAADPRLLQIADAGAANRSEYRILRSLARLSPTSARLTLDSPLRLSYANGADVDHLDLPGAPPNTADLDPAAAAGDAVLFVDDRGVNFDTPTDLLVVQQAGQEEVRRLGELRRVTLSRPLPQAYGVGTLVEGVTLGDDTHITIAAAGAGDGTAATPLQLTTVADAAELSPGQSLQLGGANPETVVIQSITAATGRIILRTPLQFAKAAGDPLTPLRTLTADARAGAGFIALDNRQGLTLGDVVRIGAPGAEEYVTVTQMPNPVPSGPNPGNVLITPALGRAYPRTTTQAVRQNALSLTNVQASVLVLDAPQGASDLLVSNGGGGGGAYTPNSLLRLIPPGGGPSYHRVTALSAALVPRMITLDAPLTRSHRPGAALVERAPLVLVQALDPGSWGDRLRVSVEDESPGLVNNTTLVQFGPPTAIRLASAAGVEAGTILEFVDAAGAVVAPPQKVAAVNRATGQITLDGGGLAPAQQLLNLRVRSREISLTVRLLRQPDPALPSRNETVIDLESFRNLSLDPRHSRYLHRVIGTTWTPGNPDDDDGHPLRRSDRRSEGESAYVRVRDLAPSQAVRLGPETLVDELPNGQRRAARHALSGGDDALATLTDNEYIGVDSPIPEERTGLQTLRNVEEISIVGIPGRTSQQLQNQLIAHCELMRYRFAVLDGPRPPADTLADVQALRQNYDTKYAALYYPWVLVNDPFPTNLTQVGEYAIPPSGHILGVYARTDVERGVHKAPANEVVRGVIGLRRVLNKEQHDLLNPYPVNISVIRDFRPNNRGIRVYGSRVITMDTDWKYVSVRRLMIFIEASLDRGLQWVVFEPNAEPLWARVRRTISDFLTVVWRNGALEGTKPEEAYFVKCDRTTMTQLDIDSGRLICVVGVAPVKPAEFVIVRIGLWTNNAQE